MAKGAAAPAPLRLETGTVEGQDSPEAYELVVERAEQRERRVEVGEDLAHDGDEIPLRSQAAELVRLRAEHEILGWWAKSRVKTAGYQRGFELAT